MSILIGSDASGRVFVKTTNDKGAVNRRMIDPGSDVSKEAQEVQDLCAKIWTPQVIAAFVANVPAPDPVLTDDQRDTNSLNDALTAPGSVVRALALVVFGLSTGAIPIQARTQAQFVQMVKGKMR